MIETTVYEVLRGLGFAETLRSEPDRRHWRWHKDYPGGEAIIVYPNGDKPSVILHFNRTMGLNEPLGRNYPISSIMEMLAAIGRAEAAIKEHAPA